MKSFNKQNIFWFSIAIIAFTSIIFSCQKSNTKTNKEAYSDEYIILTYSQIGKIHNSGLDFVYTELQNEKSNLINGNNSKAAHEKIYKLIDKSVNEFVNKTLSTKNFDLEPFIEKNNSNNPINEYLNKDLVSQIKYLKQSEYLSNTFFSLMDQLNSLVDNDASKIEFENLMKNGISELSGFDEKSKFVSCISIGYSSMQYWKTNLNKWQQLLNNGNSQTITKVSSSIDVKKVIYSAPADDAGKAIGKADITGIITGGVGGCVLGASGGTAVLPVVGTLTGCAAVGSAGAITVGLGNSAKAAVESFVNWLTK